MSASVLPDQVLLATQRAARAGFTMSCHPDTGRLLAVLAAAVPRGGRVLELGTGTGVGTAWLTHGLGSRTDVEVRTVEIDPATAKLAAAMAKLNSHRSQTHIVHRTEVRALQSPPEPSLVSAQHDPEPPTRYYDARGNRRPLTNAEVDKINAWSERQSERDRRRILAEEAEQGTPSPNSDGSNSENGPRVRLP